MLQRARMAQVQATRTSMGGYRWMDPDLARELWLRIPESDRGLWYVITSGQLVTAERAVRCGMLRDNACCFCGGRPRSWRHLLYERRHMEQCRAAFVGVPGDSLLARDLRVLCRKVIDDPAALPQVTALYGIPVEIGGGLHATLVACWGCRRRC